MAFVQENVVRRDGKYVSINPKSKNITSLNKEEVKTYLLNKETLSPEELDTIVKDFIPRDWSTQMGEGYSWYDRPGYEERTGDTEKWREVKKRIGEAETVEELSNQDIENIINFETAVHRKKYSDPLIDKAFLQIANERGAQSTEFDSWAGNWDEEERTTGISGKFRFKRRESILPPEPITQYPESIDPNQLYPGEYPETLATPEDLYPVSEEIIGENVIPGGFGKFAADQSLKTQQILGRYNSETKIPVLDMPELSARLDKLDSPFRNIKPEFLETLQTVANSNKNFTGFNGANDVIDAVSDMINNDKPLASSNFTDTLQIVDSMVVDNLKNMGNVLDVIGERKAVNEIVRPITNQMKKFAGNIGNVIGNVPENIASFVARQDPVTNEIPGGIIGSGTGEGFEETFQKTYGDMPELQEEEE
jgi:hypothetical protein